MVPQETRLDGLVDDPVPLSSSLESHVSGLRPTVGPGELAGDADRSQGPRF